MVSPDRHGKIYDSKAKPFSAGSPLRNFVGMRIYMLAS